MTSSGRLRTAAVIVVALGILAIVSTGWALAQEERPTFVLVFVPVAWQGSMDEFHAAADTHARVFIEASGIEQFAKVEVQYVEEILSVGLKQDNLVCQIERFGLLRVPGDRYIGLTDGDVAPRGESSVVGWTHMGGAAAICEVADPYVTPHELGHTFGLCDEYAYGPWENQDRLYGCPNPYPEGCSTDKPYLVNCKGWPAKGSWCIMGPAGLSDERDFGPYCQEYLDETFERMFPALPIPTPSPPPTSTPEPANVPSGTLAFGLERDDAFGLCTFQSKTGEVRWVLDTPGHSAYAPTWSPDGQKVAFVSGEGGTLGIHLFDLSGDSVAVLWDGPSCEESPAWSPDGDRIAFVSDVDGQRGIYGISTEGGDPILLIDAPGEEIDPAWSPDGRSLAFSSDRDGDFDLYTADIAPNADWIASTLTRRTDWPGLEITPAWSPDGQSIVFAASRDGVFNLHLLTLSDGRPQVMTSGEQHRWYPTWMPGGEWVAFQVGTGQGVELRFLHLPTGEAWVPPGAARYGVFPAAQR